MIMGILNVTPDSFSDGGAFIGVDDPSGTSRVIDLPRVVAEAKRMVAQGADFLDVGGQSTRPGAARVSPEEEAKRVVPVIRALRDAGISGDDRTSPAYISVDTFYGAVATAAAAAGADVINDVSGGTLDQNMLRAVAGTERPLPYVAMHMRGDPGTMMSADNTSYAGDVATVVGEVGMREMRWEGRRCVRGTPFRSLAAASANHLFVTASAIFSTTSCRCQSASTVACELGPYAEELAARARDATAAGVEPWRVWSDPGLGFAKTHDGCWELLRELGAMRASLSRAGGGCLARAPMLLGASRKGFIGAAVARARASDRDAATAAACVAGVAGGADVVRVHNVEAVVDALKVADAVWRRAAS